MPEMEWSNDYATGIDEIDKQHIFLFDLVNRLIREAAISATPASINEVIEELVRYTVYHFDFEEGIMKKVNYPHYTEHKKKHEGLKAQVQLYAAELRAGGLDMVDFVDFMKSWLKFHILREDMKYVAALAPVWHGK
ncbi:MAG TPA: bacteriohemerythrin [Turneriella sp.]|nr:bacteriohemerythrin [Turneriella sp.]